jgi:hypothetical protein
VVQDSIRLYSEEAIHINASIVMIMKKHREMELLVAQTSVMKTNTCE